MTKQTVPMLAAVIIGYLLLLTASLVYLEVPWNLVVAALILIKGLMFGWVISRATGLGRKQAPPRP